jgi:hypothetical protein
MNNTEELKQLYKIDVDKVTKINMTSLGILDTFGKLVVSLYMEDNVTEELTFISPVPVKDITNWLKENNLIDQTTLREY